MMRFLIFIFLLLFLGACNHRSQSYYSKYTIRECDSLLNTTALSARERASIIMQFAILHTPVRGNIQNLPATTQDSCLNMLTEALGLAPRDMHTDLKITILPFYISRLTSTSPQQNFKIKQLISQIENSPLTPQQEAWYLCHKIKYYTILKAHREALSLCKRTRQLFIGNKDKQGEFNLLLQMSIIHMILQNYDKALKYCKEAEELQKYHPTVCEQQKLNNQYALLYEHLGRYDEAIEAFRKCGRDSLQNFTFTDLYLKAGRYTEALKALEMLKQHTTPDQPFRNNFYARIEADIYEAAGEKEKAADLRNKAIHWAEKNAMSIREKNPGIPGIPLAFASTYASQAQWLWHKGQKEKAVTLLRKAENLAVRSPYISKENLRILDTLTRYFKILNNYQAAFQIQQQRDSLQYVLNAEDNQRKNQIRQVTHEIELLDSDIARQKAEIQSTQYQYILLIVSVIVLPLFIILTFLLYRYRRNTLQVLFKQQKINEKTTDIFRKLSPQELTSEGKLFRQLEIQILEIGNFSNPDILMEELCKQNNTNKTYISALIFRYSGVEFNTWLNRLRTEYIISCLTEPIGLSTVQRTGFPSKQALHDYFKKQTGLTIRQYIRFNKKQGDTPQQ